MYVIFFLLKPTASSVSFKDENKENATYCISLKLILKIEIYTDLYIFFLHKFLIISIYFST